MITRKGSNTGMMGLNFGHHDEQRRRLAEERKQEYNRMLTQKTDRERRYTVVPPSQVVERKLPPPLPKRPPSSIAAFGNAFRKTSLPPPSSNTNGFNYDNLFPAANRNVGFNNSLSTEFDYEKNNFEGALNQLQSSLLAPNPGSISSDVNFPPPRFSGAVDAGLNYGKYSASSNGSTYKPSILDDTSRRRGEFDDSLAYNNNNSFGAQQSYKQELEQQVFEKQLQNQRQNEDDKRYDLKKEKEIEEYNPWGKGGAGAPNKDSSGNIISSRSYRHAGHTYDPSSNASTESNFKEQLRHQIEDNKRREKEKQLQRKQEDELLEKRAQEQAGRMKQEYEAEQQRQRNKEESLRKKQEMMRNIQEQQIKQEKQKKLEMDDRRRRETERRNSFTHDDYLDPNRTKSPIIPTLRSKNGSANDKFSSEGQSPPTSRRKFVQDSYSSRVSSSYDNSRVRDTQQALDTLSSVRQRLQERQQELQRDIEEQRKTFHAAQKERKSDFIFDSNEDLGGDRSVLKTAARIRTSVDSQTRKAKSSLEIGSKNKARMRKLHKLQRDAAALDNYTSPRTYLEDYS